LIATIRSEETKKRELGKVYRGGVHNLIKTARDGLGSPAPQMESLEKRTGRGWIGQGRLAG